MPHLSVAADGSHLQRDGTFFPYIADTAWSAFADATEAEWLYYLQRRRQQGFTSVAVSILPILHDRTVREDAREPFALDADGHYDFSAPDPAYFANAERFTALARQHGITLTLVVLWCNYVEGTWGADLTPWAVMPEAQRRAYVSLVVSTFGSYEPIFAVSGDDHFTGDAAIRTYAETLAQLAAEAPECLRTAHSSPHATMPDVLGDSSDLDFFVYQSGHDMEHLELTHELAQRYRERRVRKPVINLEPPYERHGYNAGKGRFTAADVRRASWWSVLGGASAGIGYGAHGVWQWHREGGEFTNPGFSLQPFPWQSAVHFRGSDDISLLAHLLARHRLYRLDADQELLVDGVGGVRAASSSDGALVTVYQPFARDVTVRRDLTDFTVHGWDLDRRAPIVPTLTRVETGTRFEQADVEGDLLLIIER